MEKYIKLFATLCLIVAPVCFAAPAPELDSTLRYDNGGNDPLRNAAVDAAGNVYVSGSRGNSSTDNPPHSYFVAKFLPGSTTPVWSRNYQSAIIKATSFGRSNHMVVDDAGSTFIALSESAYFGGIVKYDANGNETVITSGSGISYFYSRLKCFKGKFFNQCPSLCIIYYFLGERPD